MIMYDNNNHIQFAEAVCPGFSAIYAEARTMFSEHRILYYWVRLREVETFRGMETDFGMLPMPMYDEAQKRYYTALQQLCGHHACGGFYMQLSRGAFHSPRIACGTVA